MDKKALIGLLVVVLVCAAMFFIPEKVDESGARYFGNEARADLNGDGLEDKVYLITRDGGGSGTFYYAVAELKTADGYKKTNEFFIGDRISPQSTFIPKNTMEIHINYAERRAGESMTTEPSVGAVKLLKITQDGVLEGLMK